MATKPRMRGDLVVFDIDDETVVYDPKGLVHHLDATAALVLHLCDGTATVRETINELARAQGVPFQSVEGNVRALVTEFRRAGLLTSAREDEPAVEPPDKREQVRREVPRNE